MAQPHSRGDHLPWATVAACLFVALWQVLGERFVVYSNPPRALVDGIIGSVYLLAGMAGLGLVAVTWLHLHALGWRARWRRIVFVAATSSLVSTVIAYRFLLPRSPLGAVILPIAGHLGLRWVVFASVMFGISSGARWVSARSRLARRQRANHYD